MGLSPAPSTAATVGPLAVAVVSQSVVAFLIRIIPTLGPVLIVEASVAPSFIGYLAAIGTAGSILFYFAGTPMIRRLGSARTLQLGMLIGAAGAALLAFPVAASLVGGSILLGIGYAPSVPAGSDVLQRFAPPRHRILLFSIKSAGVPLGGVLAGIVLPPLVLIEWRLAIVASVVIALLAAVSVQPLRERVDRHRDRSLDLSLRALFAPENLLLPLKALRLSRRIPPLVIASSCLAAAQGATFAFLVTFFVTGVGFDLASAGLMFSVVQATGILGRIVLGGLTDRIGRASGTLCLIGFASAATSAVFAIADAHWSFWSLALLAAVCGITMSAWNGLILAEIAAIVPPERVTEATAGATLVIFLGYVAGPIAFALVLDASGGYRLAFLTLSALTVVGSLTLLASLRGRAGDRAATP